MENLSKDDIQRHLNIQDSQTEKYWRRGKSIGLGARETWIAIHSLAFNSGSAGVLPHGFGYVI